MPKELIHFKIAERTARQLSETRFAPCIQKRKCGLLLGSVFHDALFYAVMPGGKNLEALAHILHGADGQDTFSLIRMQARHAQSAEEKDLTASILVGIISHLYADTVMHPMVWHFTGNYYADDATAKSEARQCHRALESLMDMVACPEMLGQPQYSIRQMLKRCHDLIEKGLPIAEIGELASLNSESTQAQLASAWSIHAGFQSAYGMRTLARTLFATRKYLPNALAEISTLFYAPQLMQQADFLTNTVQFRHPVTNAVSTTSLNAMIDSAADKAATLCRQLEPVVFDGKESVLSEIGPSLDAGLPGVATSQMLHFANTPFPDLT